MTLLGIGSFLYACGDRQIDFSRNYSVDEEETVEVNGFAHIFLAARFERSRCA